MWSLPILFRQYSYPVVLVKMLYTFIILHSFHLRWFQFKFCWSYSFPYFKCFLMPVHLLIIHFSLFNCSGVLKISRRFVFPLYIRSSSFEDVISFKSFNSTGAFSFSSNLFNGVSFEWALTHRFFTRILPDSSNSPGVVLNSFQVDVKSNSISHMPSPRSLSNSFHLWLNFSSFTFSRSSSVILVVFLVVIWRSKKSSS